MLSSFVDELPKNKAVDNIIITSTNFDRYYPEDKIILANI